MYREIKPINTEEIELIFHDTSEHIAVAYDFPELHRATFSVMSNGHNEKRDDVFPMRSINSRKLGFEFSENRYNHFNTEFHAWLNSNEVEKRDLDLLSKFLFIGAAVVRPIIEFEQVRIVQSSGPRHMQVLKNFYSSSKDIDNAFNEIFKMEDSEHKTISTDILDSNIPIINGMRVALSYLYGGYSNNIDKKEMFSELLRDSRESIKESVRIQRPHFNELGRAAYGRSEGSVLGNFLTASTIPSWLIALASPVTAESYKHLGSNLWEEKFQIEPAEISTGIIGEKDEFIFDDETPTFTPSTYTK